MKDFTNPEAVKSEPFPYPTGPYGYSPFLPMDMRFQRPLRVKGFYLKKHRSPDFYLKNSFGQFEVQGYLNGKLALNATVGVLST